MIATGTRYHLLPGAAARSKPASLGSVDTRLARRDIRRRSWVSRITLPQLPTSSGALLDKPAVAPGGRVYTFEWNKCRTTRAEGEIVAIEGKGDRQKSEQTKMLNVFFGDDSLRDQYDAGHLIANTLGGSGQITNLVPQKKALNEYEAWRKMEQWIHGCLKEKPCQTGWMSVDVHYDPSRRKAPARDIPTSFTVTFKMKEQIQLTLPNANIAPIQKKPGDMCP